MGRKGWELRSEEQKLGLRSTMIVEEKVCFLDN
jgi:hypothetical protein